MNISDYRFTALDYQSLTYNVTVVDAEKDLLEEFPGLKAIPELNAKMPVEDRNLVLRFIILFYDRGTPLKKIDKQNDRKMYAALIAGMEYNEKTGKFPLVTEDIFRCKDHKVNSMILGYVRNFNNIKYASLTVGYEMYYQKLVAVLDTSKKSAAAEKAKGVLWEQAMKMRVDLEKMADEILTDPNPFLKEDLYLMANTDINKNLMIFPEERIEARKQKADAQV